MEEAKKLIGTGKRHLVMGDVVSAVGVFQDACGMLATRYGDTADECGEAFFLCGKSLLELARMENSVLGNALDGVPEESEEEEKPENPNIESANNLDEKTRDELRWQVYEAMAEKEKPEGADSKDGESSTEVKKEDGVAESLVKYDAEEPEPNTNASNKSLGPRVTEEEAGASVPAEAGASVPAEAGASVPAEAGASVPAEAGASVPAEAGASVPAEAGASVPAEAGASVPAEAGASVPAEAGASVPAEAGASVQENGAEISPVSLVNGVEKGPTESPGKKTVEEDKSEGVEEQTGDGAKPEEAGDEESTPEAEQDEEGEGSRCLDDDDDDDEEEEGEGNAEDKEEDVGNLQLAWEMLEVAKVIYKRNENKDEQLMAAQTYLKLGEVSAESGNYPQALEDFQECLALQLKHLPPHSRLLAESHYHVATTLCYMDQYSQAIQHYNSSIKVIENRLAMLQEVIDAADGAAEEENEMEELKLLLPDIKEKVEDAKESQRTASAASQAIQQTLGGASTSSAFPGENGGPSSSSAFATPSQISVRPSDSGSSTKGVSDISHLVRKKRKPEEESPVKDADAKQAKQEATVNGGSGDSSASNGNGVQEKEASDGFNSYALTDAQ
ncbi:nuclear autoantigenic sperm protein [Diretmus argenteus]